MNFGFLFLASALGVVKHFLLVKMHLRLTALMHWMKNRSPNSQLHVQESSAVPYSFLWCFDLVVMHPVKCKLQQFPKVFTVRSSEVSLGDRTSSSSSCAHPIWVIITSLRFLPVHLLWGGVRPYYEWTVVYWLLWLSLRRPICLWPCTVSDVFAVTV